MPKAALDQNVCSTPVDEQPQVALVSSQQKEVHRGGICVGGNPEYCPRSRWVDGGVRHHRQVARWQLEVNLPTPPGGHFWRVARDELGRLHVELRRRSWIGVMPGSSSSRRANHRVDSRRLCETGRSCSTAGPRRCCTRAERARRLLLTPAHRPCKVCTKTTNGGSI